MRERYTRELKRFKSTDNGIKQECPPDAATANISWSLFDEMSFLYDHVKLRKTRYTFEKIIKSDPIMIEEQLVDQNTSEATTAGQVYAKFKVQSVDGSDGESRILVNEDYKDYSQLQTVNRKSETVDIKCHDSYVIINECADINSGRGGGEGDEHEIVVAEEGDEEEEAEEDEEEEEFLTDEPHHHQTVVSSGHRIILTAPRDNTPSPQPLPPPPSLHHHSTGGNAASVVAESSMHHSMHHKSLKRKHNGTLANPTTTTTTMTIEPADHAEIVSVHQHNTSHGSSSAAMIHHVQPMQQQQQTLIGPTATMHTVHQDDNDFFGSAVSGSLRQLSRLYNIKAKVEIYKVLEKFIEMEDRK